MTVDFRLPDLAEGVAEGEVVAWHVAEGDRVAEDDVLAEIETDKALVEVPSPYAGVVAERCAADGEVVPVGEVLARFEVDDATDESTGGTEPETDSGAEADDTTSERDGRDRPVPAPPSVRRLAREEGVDLETVEGSGPGGRVTRADVEREIRGRTGRPSESGAAAEPREGDERGERATEGERRGRAPETGGDGGANAVAAPDAEPNAADAAPATPARSAERDPRDRTLATPATRRVADELGVDLDRVPASEKRNGEAYVTEEDVRAYAEGDAGRPERPRDGSDEAAGGPERESAERGEAATVEGGVEREDAASEPDGQTTEATAAAVEAAAAALGEDAPEAAAPHPAADDVSGERVPYRGVRRTIGERLARSARTVPHATHHDSVDARRLVEVRESLNAETDVGLTYTAFVVRAVVSGLAAHPALNARLDEEAEEIVYRDEYNVGVAVATEAGLMVPVVEDADELGLEALAARIADLAARARDRSLAVEELRGGSFTVSNVGAVGGEYATPIVNHPEVAVLALGAIRERPRVVDGEVVARPTLPLSLSIDHRVVDGAAAAAFTNHVMERLREPARLLL
ncbi:MAG: 2-oxo acid dehydrogenase subunit E2 [Haloferacaceae archaeon]